MEKRIFRECEVKSVDDDQGGLRIKVKLDPEDNNKTLDKIPWCYPLIPKHFHINPKVGEMVLVITSKLEVANSYRWFIGPIIAQQYGLYNENFLSAQSLLEKGNITKPFLNPKNNPDNEGTYPDREDIAIQGRNNADLILKDSEVRLRCGFKKNQWSKNKDSLIFNNDDLAYIQMKYKTFEDPTNKKFFSSTINIVADRINLLSHDSKTYFNLKHPKSLITDDELLKILENGHPLPYGDKLINFLKQLITVIKEHTHSFPQNSGCFNSEHQKILNTNLDEMLSTSIRIN